MEPNKNLYNEEIYEGFDYFLNEMSKRDMKAVIYLNNYWEWTGGFGQYVEWEGGNFEELEKFYTMPGTIQHYQDFIGILLNRVNTFNNVKYSEDPTVMAWQLANEPRSTDCVQFQDWILDTITFIKSLAPNHLVSLGNEGTITS